MKSHSVFAVIYYTAMPCLRFPGYAYVSSRAFFHSFLKSVFKKIVYRRWSEVKVVVRRACIICYDRVDIALFANRIYTDGQPEN